jgi:hypothetical protein
VDRAMSMIAQKFGGCTAPHRCVEGGVQEMHLLQVGHRISVEQVAQTLMEEHL